MFNLIEKHKNISLHLMVVILGITGILGKLITLNAIHLVWYRMLIAFIALLLFLAYKKQLFSLLNSNIRTFIEFNPIHVEMVFEKFRKNPEISVFSSLGRVILFFDKKFEFYDKIDS